MTGTTEQWKCKVYDKIINQKKILLNIREVTVVYVRKAFDLILFTFFS